VTLEELCAERKAQHFARNVQRYEFEKERHKLSLDEQTADIKAEWQFRRERNHNFFEEAFPLLPEDEQEGWREFKLILVRLIRLQREWSEKKALPVAVEHLEAEFFTAVCVMKPESRGRVSRFSFDFYREELPLWEARELEWQESDALIPKALWPAPFESVGAIDGWGDGRRYMHPKMAAQNEAWCRRMQKVVARYHKWAKAKDVDIYTNTPDHEPLASFVKEFPDVEEGSAHLLHLESLEQLLANELGADFDRGWRP
jgi:hypothetical protein